MSLALPLSVIIWDFGNLPFPLHFGKYIIKIGKISTKIHKIGKIKAIFGLGMTPILGGKTYQIKSLAVICKCPWGPAVSNGGSRIIFLVINVFHRGPHDPREAIGPLGSNCFSRGSVPEFLMKHIVTCDFKGIRTPCPPSHPSGSAHAFTYI